MHHGIDRTASYTPTEQHPTHRPNSILHTDLLIPTFREEITKHSIAHKAKLLQHTNQLIPIILEEQGPKRLKRYKPTDLTHRLS